MINKSNDLLHVFYFYKYNSGLHQEQKYDEHSCKADNPMTFVLNDKIKGIKTDN